jgi:membrane peptidoglycan carboxypeptidase
MPPLMPKTPRPATLAVALPPPVVVPAGSRTARKRWRRRMVLRHYARKQLRRARASESRRRTRFWLSTISTLVFLFILLSSLVGAGLSAAYSFYQQTQQQYGRQVLTLQDLLPLDNLKMYDSKGVLIGQLADQGLHTAVTFDQIAPALAEATVATEDKNFWTNEGIDPLRILRAALDDVRSGRVVEGGSTITQQLIKNLVVGNEVTLKRKLQEIALTTDVNQSYSKSDILTMYLNSIYYGEQAYGIDAAAQVYFGLQDKPGKPAAAQLDLAQSAMLAGIPVSPALYDPLLHPQTAFNRFTVVLEAMIAQHYITRVQALDAINEEQGAHFFRPGATLTNRAPHFFNFALQQLEQLTHLNRQQLSRSGLQVYTTLDVALQDKIQKIAQQHVAELRAAHNVTNAAEVLIDYHTGAIISLLGSIDYNDSAIDGQFDVATQGYRQPGSSFKPYVYVTAFAQGASPAQAIDDAPVSIPICCGQPNFTPGNYDLHFHGQMTLRCALQNSLNVPAVRVLEHVGISAAMQTAYNMGITSYEGTPGYSLVLGGLGIRLIDQTSAMGVFANGGVRVGYYAINRVVFASTGKVLYQHGRVAGKQVINPQLAYLMTSVLSDNTDRIPEFFDCNVLQLYANSQQACYAGNRGVVRPAAAKTGTTQDFRDNWTVGYTTDYVMGVWVGNDDNSPMIDVTGVQGAAPIWHDSMLLAEQGHPIRDFANPGGLERATVTYPDGVKTTDWFLPGTVPTFQPLNPTPTPTGIATPAARSTSAPTTGGTTAGGPVPAPYCPADYSFAFPPPANNGNIDGVW